MGKKVNVMIQLADARPSYFPGQYVNGKIMLDLQEELKVNAVNIKFNAYANVRWSESKGSGKNRRTVTYTATEVYCNTCANLLNTGGDKDFKLHAGKSEYPFSVQIPMGAPSSYEAQIGKVRYLLQAHVDRPWAFDSYANLAVTVTNLLDLNTLPNLCTPGEFSNSKTLCCLCCESDPISATMKVHDRTGFVPGEAIVFSADIDNKSNRDMTASIGKLIMQVRYHATRKTRVVNNVLYEVKHGKIDGGGTDVWRSEKLHIPPVPPSYLQGCNIIDIRYYATMVVDPAGPGFDLDVPVEVVVGNIPLRHIAQQHGMTLPEPQPQAPLYPSAPEFDTTPTGAPQSLYTDSTMPVLPQATYAESAFGRVSTREDGDKGEQSGQTEFAPVYTYYKWDKPEENFAVKMDEN